METWLIILIVVLSILLLLAILFFVLVPYIMAVYTIKPHKKTIEEARKEATANGLDLTDYDSFEKIDYVLDSYDGYKIHVEYLPHPNGGKKYIIISHGYTWNRIGSIEYLYLYRKLGYNVIIYDNRGHGENKNVPVTFGYFEAGDLNELIKDTYKRYGEDIYLGLQGESMGTGLTITALKYKPNVRFFVADCGYGEMYNVLDSVCRNFTKFPTFLVPIAFQWVKVIAKFDARHFNPEESLKDNEVPICYIHGDADKFVPTAESVRMDKLTTSYPELHLFKGSEHACCYHDDPVKYEEIVRSFLKKVGAPE